MPILIDLPEDLENELRSRLVDLEGAAKEAFAVELHRQGKLTHAQVARLLGLSRIQTDELLKRHAVYYDLTLTDVLNDADTSRRARQG